MQLHTQTVETPLGKWSRELDNRLRNDWCLFVEDWLKPPEAETTVDKVKAYGQDCVFMRLKKAEDPSTIKSVILQVK